LTTSARTAHVARSALLVGALFTADKVLAVIRDMVIGRVFGIAPELDAYYAAFELPDGLFTVVAGAALVTALMPLLTARLEQPSRDDVWHLVSAVLNWVLLIVAGVSAAALVLAPQVIALVAPGFDAYRAELATRLMRLVLLQTLIASASSIATSSLQAHQHFLLPAAAPLAYTLGRIGGALFLAPRLGIFGLAYGGLAGTLGHFLIQVPGLLHYRARWVPTLHDPDLRPLLKLMVPRMLGLGATYLTFVLPTFLGSRLETGMIAAYEYAWRLMQFPETIIGTALGITVFPTLAAYANAGERSALKQTTGWALRLILALGLPAAVMMALVGRALIALMFQRGAFDAAATARVYVALQWLTLALVAHALLEVVARFFFAQRDMWRPFGAALIGLLVNLLVSRALLSALQQGAIALGNGLGALTQVLLLYLSAWQRETAPAPGELARTALRVTLATGVMAAAVLGARTLLFPTPGLLPTALLLALAGGSYLLAAWALRIEEITTLIQALLRRAGR